MASSSSVAGKILKRANPSTIQDKFLVGYQGWFTCPGDGEPVGPGHHGWLHWFNHPIPDGGRPNTDVWPDVSTYSPSELFPAPGLKRQTGEQVFLFSSRNPQTVQRHFHWMAEHNVDGAFLQRFAGQCDLESGNEGIRRIRDEVGDRVREAAEKEGRVFAIMYDVSGVPADRIQRVLEHDWMHLVRTKRVLDSPAYLHEKGRPVIALWGFGFSDAGHTPALVRSVTQFFRNATPGGAYIFGGAPSGWRTGEGDADNARAGRGSASEWLDVWLNEFDAISPWTIGRYKDDQEADEFAERKMKGDVEVIKRRNEAAEMAAMRTGARPKKVDYIPVVFPGGSGYNLSEGKWGFNDIKRRGGRFLWKQVFNAKRLGVRTMYGAMWDEYDEGTAFMPIVEHKRNLPQSDKFQFLALDADGFDVPSDWYMRICGFAAEGLRSERRVHETFPVKELQDYWSSRPRYEESVATGGSSSADTSGSKPDENVWQSYEEFLEAEKKNKQDEAPPPPYILEAEEVRPTPASVGATPAAVQPQTSSVPPAQAAPATTIQLANSAPQPAPISTLIHNQVPSTTVSPAPQATGPSGPATATAPPPVNTSTYPGYNSGYNTPGAPGPSQPYNAPAVDQANFQHQPQDPVGALANDLGRQTISGQAGGLGGPGSTYIPLSGVSPPPVHPTHPAAGSSAYGRQSRPQSQSGLPGGHYAHAHSRPQSQQGYPPIPGGPPPGPPGPPGPAPPPVHSQNQPSQWPPAEWGVGPHSSAPPPAGPPQSSYTPRPPPPSHPHVSGANLSRPQSFSASSYGAGGGANLRPSASLHSTGPAAPRPPSRPSTAASNLSTPGGSSAYPPSAISEHPPSSYPSAYPPPSMRPPQASGSSYTPSGPASTIPPPGGPPSPSFGHGSTPYPQPGGSSYTPSVSPGLSFLAGPPPVSSYAPPVPASSFPGQSGSSYPSQTGSSYLGQTGSSYPGQQGGPSLYNAPPVPPGGPSYAPWSGGPSHISPPQSPPGHALSFPGQSTYPQPPPARPYGDSDVSNPPLLGGMPGGSGNSSPAPQFPQVSGGDTSYFAAGGGGSMGSMPGGSSSSGSSYPGQHGPSSTSAFPGQYPQPSPAPWVPSGPGGSSTPPAIPPRPPTQGQASSASSGSSSGPGFPMASTAAYGYAMSAVDKVAGRKTRQQLESQVGSLAKSGSKLYNKFMK